MACICNSLVPGLLLYFHIFDAFTYTPHRAYIVFDNYILPQGLETPGLDRTPRKATCPTRTPRGEEEVSIGAILGMA